jgi:cell division protein FtsQ
VSVLDESRTRRAPVGGAGDATNAEGARATGRRRRVVAWRPFRRRRTSQVADRWVAKAQRQRRWRVVGIIAVLALIAFAVWAVWFSPLLAVQRVSVVGLSAEGELVGGQEVRSAASIPIGTPIAQLDTDLAQRQIALLPWVETVEVRRAWPNDIVIAVSERTPIAVLDEGQIKRGIDAAGNVFDPPGGLWLTDPLIKGSEDAVVEAVQVVSSLPEDLLRRVRVIQAVSVDDVRLQLGNESIVRWGNAGEAEFKAEVLRSLLPRRAQSYDVSAPSLPATFGEKGPKK